MHQAIDDLEIVNSLVHWGPIPEYTSGSIFWHRFEVQLQTDFLSKSYPKAKVFLALGTAEAIRQANLKKIPGPGPRRFEKC